MGDRRLWAAALAMGGGLGLATGVVTAPPPARAALRELAPGMWQAEVGDFTHLVSAVAFAADDIWAAGDGIVHFDGAGWRQTLPGKRPFFHAIDGLSGSQLWAAGAVEVDYCDAYGVVYRFDGRGWQAETVETHAPLFGMDMVSATDGWAVGGTENAIIVRYDGTAWRAQVAPEVAGLRAVHAVAPDNVWAVGDRGAMAHFDGRAWQAVAGPRFAYLTDVHFLDGDQGWAVGVDATLPAGVVLAYRGGQWLLDSIEELPQLSAVQMLAPSVTVAVGARGAILFHDGRAWREVGRTYPGGYAPYGGPGATETRPGKGSGTAAEEDASEGALEPGAGEPVGDAPAAGMPAGGAPGGQELTHALNSLVVLPDRETMIAVGYAGQVVQIEDTLQWTELHTGHELLNIDMLDAGYGWVVGSGGRPLHWDGAAWTAPSAPASARWLRDVAVVARDDVWAVGRRGTVLHWDGTAWTAVPSFTWLDLLAVAFAGPDDGWAVANAFEDPEQPWESVQESYVFHWDGQAWRQAIRLCGVGLADIAALGAEDVWFTDPAHPRVLHFDGQSWSWHPVWGSPRADGPASGIQHLAVGADGSAWGTGYVYVQDSGGNYYIHTAPIRLEDGIWRTQPHVAGMEYLRAMAGASADGVWGLTWDNRLVRFTPGEAGQEGQLTPILDVGPSMQGLAVVPGPDGVPNAWLIGLATTVIRYRAPSAAHPQPLATATAPLPPPRFHPTPTPYSVYDRDEAMARVVGLVDPEDSGEVRVDSLRLMSLATLQQVQERDYLSYPWDEDLWYWDGRGSLYLCDRSASYPVWMAEVSVSPRCASHALVALDAAGRDAWGLQCYPRRLATVYLPMLLRPRDGGMVEPTATTPPDSRDLTPEPVTDIIGACPTSTPWPDDPGGEYPGPGG